MEAYCMKCKTKREMNEPQAFFERVFAEKRKIEPERDQCAENERGLGSQRAEKLRVIEVHGAPPFNAACMSGDCSAGVIQLSSTSGFRPT